ncbi:hypothetical protein PV325_010789 [Microctonus aethiopoides]|nr:hypothetical protein PV325_010789 [Microctonus aethiopoides]KAK0091903.1 hypothetical protein PV326_002559 [Microctonus aethiopoides]
MSQSRQTLTSPSSKLSFASKHLSGGSSSRLRLTSMLALLNGRGSVAFRTGKSGFKVPRYQNTYQLHSSNPFSHIVVDKIVVNVMTEYLTDIKYNPIVCLKLCQNMAMEIRKQIYKKDFNRYKYAVMMTIIEKTGQGINSELGFLWDAERDSYSKYIFETRQFYAIGIVAGVYYE